MGNACAMLEERLALAMRFRGGRRRTTTVSAGPNSTEKKLLDDYKLDKVIGRGAYGTVYTCTNKTTNEYFAVKLISKDTSNNEDVRNEVDILKLVEHNRIAQLELVFSETTYSCLVFQWYRGGDAIEALYKHWESKGDVPVAVAGRFARMMFEAVAWIHSKGVIHRDIKGDNFLLDFEDISHENCKVYLTDFGTARQITPDERLNFHCGTKPYWAPEVWSKSYNISADVWAVGVLLVMFAHRKFLFQTEKELQNREVPSFPLYGPGFDSILQRVLVDDDAKRITAVDALKHEFCISYAIEEGVCPSQSTKLDANDDTSTTGETSGISSRQTSAISTQSENAWGSDIVGRIPKRSK